LGLLGFSSIIAQKAASVIIDISLWGKMPDLSITSKCKNKGVMKYQSLP